MLTHQPERPPGPGLANHVPSDSSLRHEESHLVLPQAVVDPPGVVGTDGALHHGHQVVDAVVADLLHQTEDAGSEEDLGVAVLKTERSVRAQKRRFVNLELVSNQIDLVHDGVGRRNVLLLLRHRPLHLLHRGHGLFGGKDGVSRPEVVVDDPVGISLPADPDPLEHTVAGELVHHQEGVDLPGLLVVVRHNAADEGRLSRHQHVDQVVQLISEVGADSLEVGHLCGRLGLHHHPLLSPPVPGGWQVLLLLGLAWVIRVDLNHQGACL